MEIEDGTTEATDYDSTIDSIVVVFNYTNTSQVMSVTGATGYAQHATQSETTGVSFAAEDFTVPALTTAVFVDAQDGSYADIAPFTSVTIRGAFTGWADTAMFYEANGVYKLSFVPGSDATDAEFGIDTDGSWNAHDQGVDFTGSTVAIGGASGNATISLTGGTRYEMTFNNNDNSFSVNEEAAATFTTVAIRSSFINSWGTDLEFAYLGLNRYELYYASTADVTEEQFGMVTDGGWNAHDQGVDYSNSEITIGGTSGNALISLSNGGEYHFFYDAANKVFEASNYAQPYDGNTLFVQGEVGAAANTLTYLGLGVYEVQFDVDPANFGGWGNAGNFDFKIANADFNNPNLGDSLDVTLPAGMTAANNGGNIGVAGITAVTTLKFTFNAIEGSVVVDEITP